LHAREETNKKLKQSDTTFQCGISRWLKHTLKQKKSKHLIILLPTMGDIFNIDKAFFMTPTFSVGQVNVANDCKEFARLRSIKQ